MDPSVIESLKVLGLPPNATLKEIKQAYKDLITVWHPDRFLNNPRLHEKASEKLKELNVAYNDIISHYQNMIFTERKANFQEQPQQPEPEPTPFSPIDKPQKSFRYTGHIGFMIVIFIAGAIFFIWGQNYQVENKSFESPPQSTAPSSAALVTPPQRSDETKIKVEQIAQNKIPDDQVKVPEQKMPAPPLESKIEIKNNSKKIVQVKITDNQVRNQDLERPKPLKEPKIKKISATKSRTKTSDSHDLSWLTYDEQSSIKSACSGAKLEGTGIYNSCLKDQLAALAQGEKRPDLSRLTYEEKSSIESVCSSAKFKDGPASYNRCLKNQLATLVPGERRPDLSRLTYEEKSSIESVCSGAKIEGPVSYDRCLNNHLSTLAQGARRPDLSRLTLEEKSSIASACGVAKLEGPASFNRCLNNNLKTLRGR